MSLASFFSLCMLSWQAVASQSICPSLLDSKQVRAMNQSADGKPLIRIALRDWLSAQIAAHLLRIALELGGHRTTLVDMSGRSSSRIWECDLSHQQCKDEENKFMIDADPESWRKSDSQYQSVVREAQHVFDAGPIGYAGHSGLYFTPKTLRDEYPTLLLHFAGAHEALKQVSDLFPRLSLTDSSSGASVAAAWAEDYPSWLEHGVLDTISARWIPSHCQPEGKCGQIYHKSPSWDTGILESLILTHGMPYEVHYLGSSFSSKLREHSSPSAALMHYWYTPDPLLNFLSSHRIVFPTFIPGCAGIAGVGHRECDFEATRLTKLASAQFRWETPEAYASYIRFQIRIADISFMMSRHAQGGGDTSDTKAIACDFAKANLQQIKSVIISCKEGAYFDKYTLTCIADCIHGSEVSEDGESCVPCAKGRYQPLERAACMDCPPGSYSDNFGSTRCDACPPGWTASEGGAINCTACSHGQFTDKPGLSTCQNCSAGRYNSNLANSACSSCEIGKFAPVDGTKECFSCLGKDVTTAWIGATSESDCVCPSFMYFMNTSSGCFTCEKEYMICKESFGKSRFQLKEGFMSLAHEPTQVYRCGFVNGCMGTRDPFNVPVGKIDICTGFHTGPTCFRCLPGYAARGDRCVSCSGEGEGAEGFLGLPPWDASVDIFFCMLGVFLLCNYLFEKSTRPPTTMRLLWGMLIGFLQACAVLGGFSVKWPFELMIWLGEVFEFRIDKLGFRSDCFTGHDFSFRLLGKLIWPLTLQAGFVFILFFWNVVERVSRRKRVVPEKQESGLICVMPAQGGMDQNSELSRKSSTRSLRDKCNERFSVFRPIHFDTMLNCMQQTHLSLFISVLAISLSMFNCMDHPNERLTVEKWPDIECYSEEWTAALPTGLAFLLVYCVGFASWIIYLVKVAPSRVSTDNANHEAFIRRYDYIWDSFHPGKWWFILIEMLFAVCLNMASILTENGYHQIYFSSAIITVYMILVLILRPWMFTCLSTLDCCMKLALGFMCQYSVVFIRATEKEMSVLEGQLTTMIMIAQFLPIMIAVGFLCLVLWRLKYAIQDDQMRSLLFAERFRDVMSMATHLSNSEFYKLTTFQLVENDRAELSNAMDILTSVILHMQPGDNMQKRRIIVDHPYVIADNQKIENAVDKWPDVTKSPEMLERRLLRKVAALLVASYTPPTKAEAEALHDVKLSRTSSFAARASTAAAGFTKTMKTRVGFESSEIDYDKIFKSIDIDGSETLSEDEFVSALSKLFENATIEQRENFDVDKDGDVDDEDWKAIFKIIDVDGDGATSVDEFSSILRAVIRK